MHGGLAEQVAILTRVVFLLEQRIAKLERTRSERVPSIKRPAHTKCVLKSRAVVAPLIEQGAALHQVSVVDVMSRSRDRAVNQARQWVMLEAHLQGVSEIGIGSILGRNHATVFHGIQAAKARRE